MLKASNRDVYEIQAVVQEYATVSDLHKPEETILNLVRPRLKSMKMLDIGVGGGRTTQHFANLAGEYVGIDYSHSMIKACKARFSNRAKTVSFITADVRNMEMLENDYFDLILISYNGLDYVDHDGRLQALGEIHRVCKSGGLFCLSTHNLNSVGKLFAFNGSGFFPTTLSGLLKSAVFALLIRLLNPSPQKLDNLKYAIINDGVHWFNLRTYYIRPEEQTKQLIDAGFKNVRIFSLDGEEIEDGSNSRLVEDDWLHYFCNK